MSGIGTNFSARVMVSTLQYFVSGDFNMVYDPAVLNVSDVEDGLFAGHVIDMGATSWGLIGGQGKLKILPDLTGNVSDGNGFTGSGYLCDILFTTVGIGNTSLCFYPTLYLEAWQGWTPHEITPVYWINSSVTVR